MNDSDGRVDGVAAAWSRFDSLAQRVDSRVLTTTASRRRRDPFTRRADARVIVTTASRWSRDDAIFTTTIRVMRIGQKRLEIQKETTHDLLSRRRFMKMA